MEFECFDFENPCMILKTEEEQRIERLQTGYITIQQQSVMEHRQVKQEDQIKKKQRKMLQQLLQESYRQTSKMQDQRRPRHCNYHESSRQCNCSYNQPFQSQGYYGDNNYIRQNINSENENNNYEVHKFNGESQQMRDPNYNQGRNYQPHYQEIEEEEDEDDEEESQFLLEDEILLDLDFFNKKGEENIDKCIMEKVSIWNDVRPVIQVVAKKNRIEIIYDNGHRLLKDFRFLIQKLEKYKDNKDAKLAAQLLQEHQKNIELEEELFNKIVKYYDHEMNVLYDMIAKNYQKSKEMAYDIIDKRDETTYFAFSIRKLNCEKGIQHLSGPFGYSKPLIDIFGGDMETYIRFIMRKGVIEHFNRQSHFIIFLMKLRIVNKTDLTVVTLDNIKIPISVTLERHSLSKIQIMPDCYKEDYLKIYKIDIKDDILKQLLEMRRSKEQFQNTIQGLEDFEYYMQSQIFYDKFYKKQRHSSDSAKMCRYRYLDRSLSNRYQAKSQRKKCEDYIIQFQGQFKRKKLSKNLNQVQTKELKQPLLNQEQKLKDNITAEGVPINDMDLEDDILKQKQNILHSLKYNDGFHDISIDSQTIKQEEMFEDDENSNQDQHKKDEEIQQQQNESPHEKTLKFNNDKKNPEQDESIIIHIQKNKSKNKENSKINNHLKKPISKVKEKTKSKPKKQQNQQNVQQQQRIDDDEEQEEQIIHQTLQTNIGHLN